MNPNSVKKFAIDADILIRNKSHFFKKIHVLLIVLVLLSSSNLTAQKEWSNWYYDRNNLLTFKNGHPELINDFIQPIPPESDYYHFYYSGNAPSISYSDPATGEMKFIISNRLGFSKNFNDFPNVNFLRACPGERSSYYILPVPDNPDKFYVLQFQDHRADLLQQSNGLQVRCPNAIGLGYSIVDLSVNNKLGDFTSVNTQVVSAITGQITIVKHANGKDVWAIVHPYNTDRFLSILFTATGVRTPVINAIGPHIGGSLESTGGFLTASHDGKWLAGIAHKGPENTELQLMSFNNATGTINSYFSVTSHYHGSRMQFSPDNSKLYCLAGNAIYQYDLGQEDILASETNITPGNETTFFDMQLAPDNKIYVKQNTIMENGVFVSYTGSIKCPNLPKYACNFDFKTLNTTRISFPDLINDFTNQATDTTHIDRFSIGSDTTLCTDSFAISAPDGWPSYRWNTGDTTQNIFVTKKGTYVVLVGEQGFQTPSGYGYMNVLNRAAKLDLGKDTTLCSGAYYLKISDNYQDVVWQNGSQARDTFITKPGGEFRIKAKDRNGCVTGDTIQVRFHFNDFPAFGADTTICSYQPLKLSLTSGFFNQYTYQWNNGNTNSELTVNKSGTYWCKMTSLYNGCTKVDTINVTYINGNAISVNDTLFNAGDSVLLKVDMDDAYYKWNTGSIAQSIYVKTPGVYIVEIGNNHCSFSDTIRVKLNTRPQVAIINPFNMQNFTVGQPIQIDAITTDSTGKIARVEFYNNNMKFFEDSIAPYRFNADMVAVGVYKIQARVYDQFGAQGISDTIIIAVTECKGSGTISAQGSGFDPGLAIGDLPTRTTNLGYFVVKAWLDKFEYGYELGDFYTANVRGYICPPQTGFYTFYISGDNQVGLYLSTNDDPANLRLIAYAASPTFPREWNKFATQKSAPIMLVKGARYYIQTMHNEIVGADHLAVAWTLPNTVFESPIDGSRLSPFESEPSSSNIKSSYTQDFVTAMRQEFEQKPSIGKLVVKCAPNPSNTYFTLSIKTDNLKKVVIMATDVLGRVVEKIENINASGIVQLGAQWRSGIYFLEVSQGEVNQKLKLIKR